VRGVHRLTTLVVRKTYGMQSEVEEHYSDLSARASDALGNVALVQSFVRIDAEVQGLRFVATSCSRCRCRCCRGGRWSPSSPAASTTITVLAIFTVGIVLHQQGLTTVGEIVMFVSFATMLIQKLEQVVSFINSVFMEAPRCRNSSTCWTPVPAVRDRPGAIDTGRLSGLSNSTTSRFPMTASGRRSRTSPSPRCRPDHRAGRPDRAPANRPRSRCCTAPFDPQSGIIKIDGMDIRG
jgi:ATP-binding cassette subfamily B protein